MMTKDSWKSWFRHGRNDHKDDSSTSGSCGLHSVSRSPPGAAPPPSSAARHRVRRCARTVRRVYVSLEAAHTLAEAGMPCPWPDVQLSAGWYLNGARVPVPASPTLGPARRHEICRRRAFLPPNLRRDPAYAIDSTVWDWWFEAEHADQCEAIEAHLENPDDTDEDYWEGSQEDSGVEDNDDGGDLHFLPMQRGISDWSRYRGVDTVASEVWPWPKPEEDREPPRLVTVKMEKEGPDRQRRPMTEEEELQAAQTLHKSWVAAQAQMPPALLALPALRTPPPPPAPAQACAWPPLQVFIDLAAVDVKE